MGHIRDEEVRNAARGESIVDKQEPDGPQSGKEKPTRPNSRQEEGELNQPGRNLDAPTTENGPRDTEGRDTGGCWATYEIKMYAMRPEGNPSSTSKNRTGRKAERGHEKNPGPRRGRAGVVEKLGVT